MDILCSVRKGQLAIIINIPREPPTGQTDRQTVLETPIWARNKIKDLYGGGCWQLVLVVDEGGLNLVARHHPFRGKISGINIHYFMMATIHFLFLRPTEAS